MLQANLDLIGASVQLLVSHCNTENAQLFGLSVYQPRSQQVSWLALPEKEIPVDQSGGFTGLCQSPDSIFAALQSRQEGKVLVFDHSMNFLHSLRLHGPCDVHAICYHQGYLYYTATRESRLMRHHLDSGKNEEVWRCEDYIHLNDAKFIDGELHILSQSSQYEPNAKRGLLYNLDRQQIVLDTLAQPHTIHQHENRLYILNSVPGELLVRRSAQDKAGFQTACTLPGYIRGMANVDNMMFAGLSAKRLFSRKQGLEKLYFEAGDDYYGNTEFQSYIAQWDTVDSTPRLINYSAYNFEIYDILPLTAKPVNCIEGDAAGFKAQCSRLQNFRLQQKVESLKKTGAVNPEVQPTSDNAWQDKIKSLFTKNST